MNELSLFTGAGGGLLGTMLLGWNHVGYVEKNEYCQKVLSQRIKDGILNEAPIFNNIRTFNSEGYAASYQGLVDVITAGFTCQPESRIGKQLGQNDDRYIWPETLHSICIIRPAAVLLENTSGVIDTGTIGRVTAGLACCGYVGSYFPLSALGLGANHPRIRTWIVAFNTDTISNRLERWNCSTAERKRTKRSISALRENRIQLDLPDSRTFRTNYDVANRMDRLEAIGNGQYPPVVEAVWKIVTGKY